MFKIAAVHHVGFVLHLLACDHPRKVLNGLYRCANRQNVVGCVKRVVIAIKLFKIYCGH